ncbi:endonuclease III [Candidatus Dependentiae bacterium]|nr:MAG: endonuclease III [Candidatus Dependentiae bacterium]
MTQPAVSQIVAKYGRDFFLILISCLLSLRTKDTISLPISLILFQYARTPKELLKIPLKRLEKIIYSIGFYRKKARLLHSVSRDIITRFGGKVPNTLKELLSIRGVGQKTANVVLAEGFRIPAIAVDTHVHRIANRLGLVKTKTPEQTERELRKIIPKRYWIELNPLLVMWGQNICEPISPRCSQCVIAQFCPRIGVTRSR